MNARSIILVAPLALAASMTAHALGVVRAPSNVALGAPLNFPISVQVASDESLNSTCVTAEVYQGDQRIAPSALRTSIEQGADRRRTGGARVHHGGHRRTGGHGHAHAGLRDTARAPIHRVRRSAAGHGGRRARGGRAASGRRCAGGSACATRSTGVRATGRSARARPQATARRQRPAHRAAGAARHRGPLPPAPRVRPLHRRPHAGRRGRLPRRRPAVTTDPTAAAGARSNAAAPRVAGPRLQLDPLEPVARGGSAASAAAAVQEAQLRVAAMAASAAIAEQAASVALANAAAAAERMRALEQGLEKLRADAERDREQSAALRLKLAQAENTGQLTPWLGARHGAAGRARAVAVVAHAAAAARAAGSVVGRHQGPRRPARRRRTRPRCIR